MVGTFPWRPMSVLNTPEMQLARYGAPSPEPTVTDGAYLRFLVEQQRQRERDRRMEEAENYAQLLRDIRDAERQQMEQEAAQEVFRRRQEFTQDLASVHPKDLATTTHHAIGALPKESSMTMAYHASRRRNREKLSRVLDAALVGYDTPDNGMQEAYLETSSPDTRARLQRAAAGFGVGMVGGGIAGALRRTRTPLTPLLMGLGAGAVGAGIGAVAPVPVRRAFDPDYGMQLSERDERRAAAVHRTLQAGSDPSNIALLSPGQQVPGFGGTSPSFAYAADIDDMVRESPEMAELLLGGPTPPTEPPRRNAPWPNIGAKQSADVVVEYRGPEGGRYEMFDDGEVVGLNHIRAKTPTERAVAGGLGAFAGATLAGALTRTPVGVLTGVGLGAALGALTPIQDDLYRNVGAGPEVLAAEVERRGLTPPPWKHSASGHANMTQPGVRSAWEKVRRDGRKAEAAYSSPHGHRKQKGAPRRAEESADR